MATRKRERIVQIPVPEIAVGDTYVPNNENEAVILRGPYLTKDMFGREMVGFWARAIKGPNRDNEGEIMFGSSGHMGGRRGAKDSLPVSRPSLPPGTTRG
jgi:hypothetical protein